MTIRDINELVETGTSLKQIAQAYGEIALIKIKKIRTEVERNRHFFQELVRVYRIVASSAKMKNVILAKPKKSVCLIISSNYGFYGGIDSGVIRLFLESTSKIPTDRIVIGRSANQYLKTIRYFHQYIYQELKNDLPNDIELLKLAHSIRDYAQVLVFYPQFSTILIQNPQVLDITQSSFVTADQATASQSQSYVIFEPELLKIMQFFDSQIKILLLEQIFFEAELSRTGSRILSMDQAQLRANKFIEYNSQLKARTLRSIANNRILENLIARMALLKQNNGQSN